MPIRNEKSEVIDAILSVAMVGGITMAMLVAPNSVQLVDKPLKKYLKHRDAVNKEKEIRKLIQYMHRQGLVKGSYEHGLQITAKAQKRLEKRDLDSLAVNRPKKWDKKWRIMFYDIPEKQKTARDALAFRLRLLGCQQLQRSVWVHPFHCEDEITKIAMSYGVSDYITYLEVAYINNQKALVKRFNHLGIK